MILNEPLATLDFIGGMMVAVGVIAALWAAFLIVRAMWRRM